MSWNNVLPGWLFITEICGCCGDERATKFMTETPAGWICEWCGPEEDGTCTNEDCKNHKDKKEND